VTNKQLPAVNYIATYIIVKIGC